MSEFLKENFSEVRGTENHESRHLREVQGQSGVWVPSLGTASAVCISIIYDSPNEVGYLAAESRGGDPPQHSMRFWYRLPPSSVTRF